MPWSTHPRGQNPWHLRFVRHQNRLTSPALSAHCVQRYIFEMRMCEMSDYFKLFYYEIFTQNFHSRWLTWCPKACSAWIYCLSEAHTAHSYSRLLCFAQDWKTLHRIRPDVCWMHQIDQHNSKHSSFHSHQPICGLAPQTKLVSKRPVFLFGIADCPRTLVHLESIRVWRNAAIRSAASDQRRRNSRESSNISANQRSYYVPYPE